MARHQLPLPRAGARRPTARSSSRLALDRAAARGRGARDRDAPGGARAVQLPAAVEGREARRWRNSCPSTRSCCGELAGRGRDRGPARRAVPRARPHGRASSTRSPTRSTALAAPIEHLPGDVLRARRSARVRAARRRAPRRPRARARSSCRRRCETPGRLSLGVLDGRNVWAADLDLALDRIDAAVAALGSDRVTIAPSCSLLHVPYEAAREDLTEIRPWLAFAAEKLDELGVLKAALDGDRDALLERRARDPQRAADVGADQRPGGAPARRARRRYERDAPYRGAPRGAARARHRCPSCRRRRSAPSRRRRRSAPRARRRPRLRALPGAHDRRGDRPPGARRPRRARARRARAQGHGRVLRRAAARVRVLRARLGAVLRLAAA